MGNSNSSQTIGFKYFLGVHAVLAQNKLRILGIKFGEKTAWTGSKTGGETIPVDNRELFGGSDAEGGVSGSIDVLGGDAAQGKNDYLQGAIGGVISAYRGVTSLVFRQFYFGNNPYIKRMAIKAIDNEIGAQWYEEKALVNVDVFLSRAEIYIAMDLSGSMSGSRLTFMKNSVKNYLESLKGTVNTVKLVGWSTTVNSTTQINDCDDDDYDTLKAWVDTLVVHNATSFAAGVSLTTAFFSVYSPTEFSGDGILENEGDKGSTIADSTRRIVLFVTDGEPIDQTDVDVAVATLDGLIGVDVYCFNIDLVNTFYTEQLDNTPEDGVPVISSSDSDALARSLQITSATWADMNVAHVLRDAMVLANRGDDSIIGDSFTEFADLCYEEGMGVSLFWRDTSTYNEFMDKVKAHADCVTYADRTTGKMEVKAIRNDFDVGTLFVYDTTNVSKWHPDISAPLQHKLPNQLTVVYTKRTDGSQASITDANIAAIQNPTVGRVIAADPIVYEGFTTDEIAGKVLSRDLAARTVPLYSGTIDVAYAPEDLNLGHAFILNNPKLGLNNLVVRLRSKTELGGRNPKTTLTFLEDKFSTPLQATVVPDTPTVVSKTALNSPVRLFAEVGYYTLVLDQSRTIIDDQLTTDPDSGILALAGSKPNNVHSSLDVATDNGAGWLLISSGGFMPASTITEDITEAGTVSFDVVANDGLRQVVAGSLCLVGTEIMRVDGMVISGDNVTMAVGRGCLDTVPEKHTAGANILFYDGFALHDPTTYTAGESIDGKILPKTSEGRLSLDDATTESVTLASRAIRPYPVGNLAMDGEITPTGIMDASVAITWAHRDRTLQLTTSVEDYEDASIGPETGVEYTVEVRAILPTEDFFAGSDFFDGFDFFTDDGDGTLIRSQVVGQADEYTYDESGVYDFFAPADFFEPSDFFGVTEPDFFAPADFFGPDWFFGVVGGRALRTQIKVSVERDGYDNWTTASVEGTHLQPPALLTLEAF